MTRKTPYEEAEVEIIVLSGEDVITASPGDDIPVDPITGDD